MKRFSYAVAAAAAGLMLASCGSNEEPVNEVDMNAAQSDQLNDLSSAAANDAAGTAEIDTLGNQANQLEQEPAPATENTATETDDADDEAMNVVGL